MFYSNKKHYEHVSGIKLLKPTVTRDGQRGKNRWNSSQMLYQCFHVRRTLPLFEIFHRSMWYTSTWCICSSFLPMLHIFILNFAFLWEGNARVPSYREKWTQASISYAGNFFWINSKKLPVKNNWDVFYSSGKSLLCITLSLSFCVCVLIWMVLVVIL